MVAIGEHCDVCRALQFRPVNDRDGVIELVRDVSGVRRLVDHDMDWPATVGISGATHVGRWFHYIAANPAAATNNIAAMPNRSG